MLSILRAHGPTKRDIAANNPLTFQNDPGTIIFNSVAHRYFMTHVIPPKSFLNPPTHIHFWQTEYFNVREGTGIWYLPTHSDPSKVRQVKLATNPFISQQENTIVLKTPRTPSSWSWTFELIRNLSHGEARKCSFAISSGTWTTACRQKQRRVFSNWHCFSIRSIPHSQFRYLDLTG
jgi:hypothetical protein